MQNINYDQIANIYARHRIALSFVVSELRQGCSTGSACRVLEVGSGTGNYLHILVKTMGCQGWGIDPSPEMVSLAVSVNKTRFLVGVAEELPFEDKFFDFVFSVDVIHHAKSTLAYFQEALRVLKPSGLICTVTDSEKIIRNRKPLAKYWPGTVKADLKRYPAIALLREQMTKVGFVGIREHEIWQPFRLTDVTPYQEKAFSCLHLVSGEEFLSGLRHLEADLKAGPVEGVSEYVCLWGQRP